MTTSLLKNRFLRFGLFPLLVYFLIFCVITWPAITQFTDDLYGDDQDTLIYVWNIWHVDKSLDERQPPWHTDYLHSPHGTTLIGHTLNLTNSLPAALLQNLTGLYQSHNLMVIFAFITSGLSAFLLAFYFSRSYWPSIVGGFIYAFSGYQMLHIGSHINLNSIQWIPLFLLFWHRTLAETKYRWAALSALFMVIIFYTELYYFLYCFLAAVIFVLVEMWKRRSYAFLFSAEYLRVLGLFIGIVLALTGPFIIQFIRIDHTDPFYGVHDIVRFSADLIAPIVPGFFKAWYGEKLIIGEGVGEAFLGVTVWGLVIYVLAKRKSLGGRFPLAWIVTFFFFLLLSLGPHLHIGNRDLGPFMPYRFLDNLIPGMSASGVPVRMIVISTLAAAVIAAIGIDMIIKRGGWRILPGLLVVGLIVFEYVPAQHFTPSHPEVDSYAYYLKALPGNEAVFDNRSIFQPLLDQTVHERPVFNGYVTRIPVSILKMDSEIEDAYIKGDIDFLCSRGFRYLAVDINERVANAEVVHESGDTLLHDLSTYDNFCRSCFMN